MLRPGTHPWTNGVAALWTGVVVDRVTPGDTWEPFGFALTGTGGSDRLTIREIAREGGDGRGETPDDFHLVIGDRFLFG